MSNSHLRSILDRLQARPRAEAVPIGFRSASSPELPGAAPAKVCADAFNTVAESNEQNNCRAVGTAFVNGLLFYKVTSATATEQTGWTIDCWKVTLDAPVQVVGKAVQAAVRYARGDRAKAAKSWQAAAGVWHFVRAELVRFWRA